MAFSDTALNAYVKRTFDNKFIENSMLSVKDSILRAVKVETDGSGEQYSWLADVDDQVNFSADFPTAQNAAINNTNTVGFKFLSDWFSASAVAQIPKTIINKTRNNDGAWMKAVDVAMNKTLYGIAHCEAVIMQGKGWGEISQISSVSGSTFVPTIASDITKYAKGMPVVFSSALNTAVLRSTTVLYVTAVNYTPGSELVTMSGTLGSVSAANSDFAFIAGCRQNSATPSRLVPAGLGGWFIDQTSGSADLSDTTLTQLYGPDRTSNSRAFGTFINASGGVSTVEALIAGANEALVLGNAKKLELFASKAVFEGVAKDLNNPVLYMNNGGAKSVGTGRIQVIAADGLEAYLNISRTTNDNQIWGFDGSQVVVKSIGGWPQIDNSDGLTMARISNSQGYEIRWFLQRTYEFRNPAGGLRIRLV